MRPIRRRHEPPAPPAPAWDKLGLERAALTDLLAVNGLHRRMAFAQWGHLCDTCNGEWPCPAERARHALAAEAQP